MLDICEFRDQPGSDAGLLPHLAESSLLGFLPGIDQALWQSEYHFM